MCMCVSVMFIKADMHRSGGTWPSVLLLTNIISITEAKRKRQMEGDSLGVQRRRGRGNFILIRVWVPWAALLMCMCVQEDGIISLMVLTHLVVVTWLTSWAQSRDYWKAANCEQQKRLSNSACACIGGVTWLLLPLKQVGFVCCSGAVSHTVTQSSLCMQSCCAGSTIWVCLMGLSKECFVSACSIRKMMIWDKYIN